MSQHAIDAFGPGDRADAGPFDAAGGGPANPAVADAGLDAGDATAGGGQAFPGPKHVVGQVVVTRGQPLFGVAADIQQQAADQERRDAAADVVV